jgi:hypothetical protein
MIAVERKPPASEIPHDLSLRRHGPAPIAFKQRLSGVSIQWPGDQEARRRITGFFQHAQSDRKFPQPASADNERKQPMLRVIMTAALRGTPGCGLPHRMGERRARAPLLLAQA